MIRLALLAIASAFFVGLLAGSSRAVLLVIKRDSHSFRKSKELGFFVPVTALLIAYAMMTLPWGEAGVSDEAALGWLWRATLLYFVAWAVVGRRIQRAIEGLFCRRIERKKA